MIIDCALLSDAAALHRALAEALAFPDWYGNNLDALYDCLTDLEETHLTLTSFPAWAQGFQAVMEDAMVENPLLHIEIQ